MKPIKGLFIILIIQLYTLSHPSAPKESLTALPLAHSKKAGFMPPLLTSTACFCPAHRVLPHTCGDGKYSAGRGTAGYLNQLYSQSQLPNFSQ